MSEEKKEILEWTISFIKKKNAIEKRGIWVERDYYIDGVHYYIDRDWIFKNGLRALVDSIKPLKNFIEKLKNK